MYNNHYPYDDGATARRSGVIATIVYVVVVILALWLTRCDTRSEETIDSSAGSIVISFGDSRESVGEIAKSTTEAVAPTPPPTIEEEVATPTDEMSDVELPQPEEERTEVIEPTPEPKEEVAEEPKPEPVREVNKRALFPGASKQQSEATQGSGAVKSGVEGTDRGTASTYSALGEGLTGDYSLAGRSLIGALPVPSYNTQEDGRVVISIMVDEKGRVTSASLQLDRTTTNNRRLIEAAREAALKARFSQSEEFIQGGTITYIFKMN